MLCNHAHECGGCLWQPTPYDQQLQHKQQIVEKLFPAARPIIGCAEQWRYRNKMEFSFSQNKAGERFLGLIMHRSRGKVFHLHECLIAPPWFTGVVAAVRKWWQESDLQAYHFHRGEGHLRTLTVREGRRTGDRLVMLTVSGDTRYTLSRDHLASFTKAVGEGSIFLRVQQCIQGTPTQFYELLLQGADHIREQLTVLGRTFTYKISPTSFFQTNTAQAEVLYNTALQMIALSPEDEVFDLYSGTATIGLSVAPQVKRVVAIELNPHATFDAKANAEVNQVDNLEVICGDVGQVLGGLQATTPALAIVDPPRAGLDKAAVQNLLRLNSKKILYISCNPETQARDVACLTGYRTTHVQPIDLFPHTPHIENIVILEKSFLP